ncbi:MAG: SLC13 family permease [Planctomycetia bacterium]|nr:SLC13 family permease [Planctomycetia bacterium]
MDPLLILLLGLLLVVGMIVCLRMNPFIALLAGALLVSFLSPGVPGAEFSWVAKFSRVATALGEMAGKIAILIVMGAIIGNCLTASGAADRIVQTILKFFGQKRLTEALMSGGFLLAVPVFYDAVFYLLLPLAKSVYQAEKKHYVLYLLAIGFGATLAHTLVPPTPGPLVVAEEMGISVGMMMLLGSLVGIGTIPFALLIARWLDRCHPQPEVLPEALQTLETETTTSEKNVPLPSFGWAILPILLPVVLISLGTCMTMLLPAIHSSEKGNLCLEGMALLGNPQVALILAATTAAWILKRTRQLTFLQLEKYLQSAISTAGMIILITSAGGALGSMLRASGVDERIESLMTLDGAIHGIWILVAAFAVAAMIKTAQGSSTTAMITTAGIFSAMNFQAEMLGFHPGYLAVVIGVGSCVTGWMNDSGFCIFSQMSGLGETTSLKTWTVGLTCMGLAGLLVTVLLSQILPFTG